MTEWGTGAGGTGRGQGGQGERGIQGQRAPPTLQGAHHRLPCTSHCNPGFKQRGLRETLLIWPLGPPDLPPSSPAPVSPTLPLYLSSLNSLVRSCPQKSTEVINPPGSYFSVLSPALESKGLQG